MSKFKVSIKRDLINLGDNLWAYPSRSGKTLEFFVRGKSSACERTTHNFRISFKRLDRIKKVLARDWRTKNAKQ